MIGKAWTRLVVQSPVSIGLLLFAVGLAPRLYALGARGFWFDEVVFAHAARLPTFGGLLDHVQQWTDHTPLSFILIWLVQGLEAGEAAVRLPFALAGALGVPALYFLGKNLASPRAGLIAALLYALSPFAVFVSQDAHPYAPLMLFSILQALFAYRAAVNGRPLDWAGFGLFTLLNLYNAYLALAMLAVTVTFLAACLLSRLIAARGKERESQGTTGDNVRQVRFQFIALAATLGIVFLLYLPWLAPTMEFLKAPVRNYYATGISAATLDDVRSLARDLGFNLLLVLLLLIGLASAFVSIVRGRKPSGLLLLIWVGAPIAGLWVLAGDRMFLLQPRYFSFLLPAALLLVGMGFEQVASIAQDAYRRFVLRRSGGMTMARSARVWQMTIAALGVTVLLLAVQALIASYSWTKPLPQGFREAARSIMSTPASVALSLGMWGLRPEPTEAIQGVEHYLWLYRSTVPYVDASSLNTHTVDRIAAQAGGIVWGVWALPWPMEAQDVERANNMGLDIIQLENLALLRGREPLKPATDQLDALLAWGVDLQPGIVATRSLLNPAYKEVALGDNILPPITETTFLLPAEAPEPFDDAEGQDKWILPGSDSYSQNNQSLVLRVSGPQEQINIRLATRKLMPGATYVLSARHSNAALDGEQRVFVSTYTEEGELIETFPYGTGFLCPHGPDTTSAFAFSIPPSATSVLLWLRAEGDGQATFSNVEIRPVRWSFGG